MTRRKPRCPICGKPVRVKPQPRTVPQQLWQCKEGLTTHPEECEWTNPMLQLALDEQEEDKTGTGEGRPQ